MLTRQEGKVIKGNMFMVFNQLHGLKIDYNDASQAEIEMNIPKTEMSLDDIEKVLEFLIDKIKEMKEDAKNGIWDLEAYKKHSKERRDKELKEAGKLLENSEKLK